MENHLEHQSPKTDATSSEYFKFVVIIVGIITAGYILSIAFGTWGWENFQAKFMAVFFLVFATFKLVDLKGFAISYMGYDIIAKKIPSYGYLYPFLELALSAGYFFVVPYTEWVTLFLMAVGSVGVFKELLRGSKIKCACLGTYIKLPLTTVSLTEDVVMGIMALLMIIK